VVTLQQQITGAMFRGGGIPGGGFADGGFSSGGATPLRLGAQVGGAVCETINIFDVPAVACPTMFPIIKKTTLLSPRMIQVGDRGYMVASFWTTGTAMFFQTTDRKIIATRGDGTMKVYTPQRHLVLSRNPRVRSLARAKSRLDRLMKVLPSRSGHRRKAKK